MVTHRATSAGNFRGRDRGAVARSAMKVLIPSALMSYTQAGHAEAHGATLATLLDDLDRQYTGIRFRMIDEQEQVRRHIRIFVNGAQVHDLGHPLAPADDVVIVQALSGG
jgi:molybdopterin synthase sulfur carrier subunit